MTALPKLLPEPPKEQVAGEAIRALVAGGLDRSTIVYDPEAFLLRLNGSGVVPLGNLRAQCRTVWPWQRATMARRFVSVHLALQGVGRGTVIDYVQVHRNADDGIEFFGGTVNARHLILTDIQDDSVDWTQGWQGKIQFGLVKQIQDNTVETDRGFELDNLEQNNDASPRSGGKLANFTVLGKAGKLGMNPRRGTGGNFSNFIVTGFGSCLDIDDTATFTAAGTPGNLTGTLTFENTILNCATNIVENDDAANPDPWSVITWFTGQPGNALGNPNLDGVFPPANAADLSGYELDPEDYDDFFDKVDWIGAFRSRDSAWHYGWTEFLD